MASGDTLVVFTAASGIPTSSNGATFGVRNGHVCSLHDDSTDESIDFTAVMPQHYAGGGVDVVIKTAATSATSGTARLSTAFELLTSQDMDSDGFATANTGAAAANGTSGIETTTTIAHTNGAQMDSVVAGSRFRLRFSRDADGTSGTDDMTGDLQLYTIEIREA